MVSSLNTRWVILIAFSLFAGTLLGGCIFWNGIQAERNSRPLPVVQVKLGPTQLNAEIVYKPLDLYRGLSGRPSLCQACGLLFVFPDKEERTFVMRQMNFPLDIIFINDNQIVGIAPNLPPEGETPEKYYKSGEEANRVLEVNGGYCERYGVKVGDQLEVLD